MTVVTDARRHSWTDLRKTRCVETSSQETTVHDRYDESTQRHNHATTQRHNTKQPQRRRTQHQHGCTLLRLNPAASMTLRTVTRGQQRRNNGTSRHCSSPINVAQRLIIILIAVFVISTWLTAHTQTRSYDQLQRDRQQQSQRAFVAQVEPPPLTQASLVEADSEDIALTPADDPKVKERPQSHASNQTFLADNKNLQILGPKRLNWYKKYLTNLTTTWHAVPNTDWCVLEPIDDPSPITLRHEESALGILYMKSYKASSSTLEGINIHIAHSVGQRVQNNHKQQQQQTSVAPICKHYNRHEFGDLRHHVRRGDPSLLWTMVREPSRRDLSHVYHFEIGRNTKTPTDAFLINTVEYKVKGRQTRYLVKNKGKGKLWPKLELQKHPDSIVQIMQQEIMEYYNFIGVVERMEESLAAMTLLWQLQPTDVIVLSAKRSGGYDDAGHEGRCVRIPKAQRTPNVERYLQNKHVVANADVLLYHAVNASLDATISILGVDRVQSRTQQIRCLQRFATERCQDEAHFPCSADGEPQIELSQRSCYVQDAGCGHACVARVLATEAATAACSVG